MMPWFPKCATFCVLSEYWPVSGVEYHSMKRKLLFLLGATLLATSLASCYTDPYWGGGYATVGTYRPYYGSSFYGPGYGLGYGPSLYTNFYSPYRYYRPSYRPTYVSRPLGFPSRSYAYHHAPSFSHSGFSGGSFHGGGFRGGSFPGGGFHHSGGGFHGGGGHHH